MSSDATTCPQPTEKNLAQPSSGPSDLTYPTAWDLGASVLGSSVRRSGENTHPPANTDLWVDAGLRARVADRPRSLWRLVV